MIFIARNSSRGKSTSSSKLPAEANEPRSNGLDKILEDLLLGVGILPSIQEEALFRLKKARLNVDETLALAMAKKLLTTLGQTFDEAFESLEMKVLDVATPPQGMFAVFGLCAFRSGKERGR